MRFFSLMLMSLLVAAAAQEQVSIEVMKEGMGPPIESAQVAVVDYTLTLDSGILIDRASVRNPFSFELDANDTIQGFSQGVKGMKVGEKRLIKIPPSLGYGAKDQGIIPANSTLIFEVELLQIKDPLSDIIDDSRSSEADIDLKEVFRDETMLNRRHAQDITKPAMFEYLIRDFFTKPWRYDDGHLQIWRATGFLSLVLAGLFGLTWFGAKRGYWIV